MNHNHMEDIAIGIGFAGHESFSRTSRFKVVSGPAKVLFSTQRWQHMFCDLLNSFLEPQPKLEFMLHDSQTSLHYTKLSSA